MLHPTRTRIVRALNAMDPHTHGAASEALAEMESRLSNLDRDTLPLRDIEKLERQFGISKNYVLFGEGEPLVEVSESDNPKVTEPKFKLCDHEAFRVRLNAVLDNAQMPLAEIAGALEVSRQSPHNWRRTAMITKDNLKKLCQIEGVDYDWVVNGIVNSEEAQKSVDALVDRATQRAEQAIQEARDNLQMVKFVCGYDVEAA